MQPKQKFLELALKKRLNLAGFPGNFYIALVTSDSTFHNNLNRGMGVIPRCPQFGSATVGLLKKVPVMKSAFVSTPGGGG